MTIQHGRRSRMAEVGKCGLLGKRPIAPNISVPDHFGLMSAIFIWRAEVEKKTGFTMDLCCGQLAVANLR